MSERSSLIDKLQSDFKARAGYIQAKVGTLVPSQIRALRLKSETPRQPDLAREAEMHQSRISMLETAGANPTIGTLSAVAAALKVGLVVKFVPFSEMLAWENGFSQDGFNVVPLDRDARFQNPQPTSALATRLIVGPPVQRPRTAGMWRHSGSVCVEWAAGDFSTLSGGNIVNLSPQGNVGMFLHQASFPFSNQQHFETTP